MHHSHPSQMKIAYPNGHYGNGILARPRLPGPATTVNAQRYEKWKFLLELQLLFGSKFVLL